MDLGAAGCVWAGLRMPRLAWTVCESAIREPGVA